MTKYMTPADVATQLGLAKPDAVLAWIRTGELSAINVGTTWGGRPTWRIAEADLEAFLASRRAISSSVDKRRSRPRKPGKVTKYF